MSRLIFLPLICLVIYTSIGISAYPLDINLKLKNLCPSRIFSFKKVVVNSYYEMIYEADLIKTNLVKKFTDKIKFDGFDNEAKELEQFKEQFNQEIEDLLSDKYLSNENFMKRNFSIKYERLNQIKLAFERFTKEKYDNQAQQRLMKHCITTVNSGLELIKRIKSFQTQFIPQTDFDLTKFEKKLDQLIISQLNPSTEQFVFSKDYFISLIDKMDIFAFDQLEQKNADRTHFKINGSILLPFHNKIYDQHNCINSTQLPSFYKTKGLGLLSIKSNAWTNKINIYTFSIIQFIIFLLPFFYWK